MKKIMLIFMIVSLCLLICSCASNEDKAASQEVVSLIDSIGDVSLEDKIELQRIQMCYDSLSETQKKLIKNHQKLVSAIDELYILQLDEDAKSDPSSSINTDEIKGLWKGSTSSVGHTAYLYFSNGVYYMASKSAISPASFTNEYKLGTSFLLSGYDKFQKAMMGNFHSSVNSSDYTFEVTKTNNGTLTMIVNGETISGSYSKEGNAVLNIDIDHCAHTGCINSVVTSGDSIYCAEHSSRCLECGVYVDEDAMFCMDCLIKAVNDLKK